MSDQDGSPKKQNLSSDVLREVVDFMQRGGADAVAMFDFQERLNVIFREIDELRALALKMESSSAAAASQIEALITMATANGLLATAAELKARHSDIAQRVMRAADSWAVDPPAGGTVS